MTTAVAERTSQTLTPSLQETLPEDAPREYSWTVEALHHAIDAGVFKEPMRLDLVHGRILERMPQGSLHLSRRIRIGRRLRSALEPRFFVVDECSVTLAADGEVVVDIAVLWGSDGDYDDQNPTSQDVALLAEVAVSSAFYDLAEKALLYAQSGIGDYWVILPEREQVVIHRDPSPDGYRSATTLGLSETVSPLAAEGVTLAVRDLLGLPKRAEA